MLNINNALLAGGSYIGNQSWNKTASSLDQCFKLYYVEKGEALLFANGEKYTLLAGQSYFINGFKIEKQCCPDSFQIHWLHFLYASILLKQYFLKFPVLTKIEMFEPEEYRFDFRNFKNYFDQQNNNKNAVDSKRLALYLQIQSLLSFLTAKLIIGSEQEFMYLLGESSRLFPAIEYINNNFRKKITLNKLASLCFMSENYFHSYFKKVFEITPNNYVLQIRMNESLQLLSNSGLSIGEVAGECGYSDAAYFSRVFTNYFSISPMQYQKLLKGRVP